jgi:hypothetical protein
MTVSPVQKLREVHGSKKKCKQRFLRMIRMEQLERRELMAGDLLPFHNYIYPNDVDGDFQISPLDALVVINELNASGPGSLADKPSPENFNRNFDVDGDNTLSPLDALSVINVLNSGEGELPPVVGVKYEFRQVNADGTVGAVIPDQNLATLEPDAIIGTGQRIIVRTTMTDLRRPTTHGGAAPRGVFSAYHDLNYTNADGSTPEKLQLQWGEFNRLTLNQNITGGSFTLGYGTQTTAAIAPAFDSFGILDTELTRGLIQTRLAALFGADNVRVSFAEAPSTSKPDYAINFIGSLARTDITPEGVVASDNLTGGTGARVTLTTRVNPSPVQDEVARAALNHNVDNGTTTGGTGTSPIVRYTNGSAGSLLDADPLTPAKRTIRKLGGFANQTSEQSPQVATLYLGVVDTLFVGAQAGLVNLNGTITPLPTGGGGGDNLGIAVYGARAVYLTASEVVLPSGTITIRDRLTAVNDMASVAEDSGNTTLNVGNNDVEVDNRTFGIINVTQPTNGAGTVTIGSGTNPKSVIFTPTKDYFGPATFTYTIQSSANDTATGTVTLDVTPVNDPPVILNVAYSATEDQTPPPIAPTSIFSPGPANESSQTLSLAIVTAPPSSQGTATININTGNLEFVPFADFFGTVNIVVRGTDSGPNTPAPNSNNTLATLTITVAGVNDAPVIVGTTFSMTEDATSALVITPAQLFTPGPANESSQTVTLAILSGPTTAQGTANISGGSLRFIPAADFFGQVIMTVRGTDNGIPPASTDSTITINVSNVNDPPIAVNDAFNVIALGDPNTLNVLSNDLPGPGGEPGTISVVSVTGVTPSTSGTVQVAPGGSGVVFTPSTSPSVFGTTATFNYTINDQAGLPATATVTVTILPPASPFAVDDDYRSNTSLVINEDTSVTVDVLANDFSRGTKSLTAGTEPAQPRIISGPGSVAIEGNLIRYTPEADRFGEVVFTYAMDDTDTVVEANERRIATVTLLVQSVNDAPIAVDRTVSTLEDTNLEVRIADLSLSSGPFENDSLVFISPTLTDTTKGSISFTAGSTSFNYVPSKDFFGQALVTYSVRDNGSPNLTSGVATITINVTPVNDPPVTSPKTLPAVEDTARTITVASVIAGDVAGPANEIAAPQNQTVSFVSLTAPITTTAGGTITQIDVNTLSYSPASDFNGTDTFVYTITDGQSANATAIGTVTISVSEVNDTPVARSITRRVFAGVSTVIDMTAELRTMSRGAANEFSQTLVMSRKVTDPSIGSITSFGATQFTYFATLGTNGTTSFQYEVVDNGTTNGAADAKTSIATITIEVLPFIPSSLKGTVFLDDDADGKFDRTTGNAGLEIPVGGVEVTLSYADPENPGRTITRTEMTESDGTYDFELLPPGTYTVSYSTPKYMTQGTSTPMAYTRTIAAPGDANIVFDFPVVGIAPEYSSYLEYLWSSYNQDGTRHRGMYAGINASGVTDWTSRLGQTSAGVFYEVVISQDLNTVYLTEVSANGSKVRTAALDRRQFHRVGTTDGGHVIRILKDPSEYTNWVDVNRTSPPPTIMAKGYLDTVDDFFSQEGWDTNNEV